MKKTIVTGMVVSMFLLTLFTIAPSTSAEVVSKPVIDGVASPGEWDAYHVGTSISNWCGGMAVDVYGFTDYEFLYIAYVADTNKPGWTYSCYMGKNADFFYQTNLKWKWNTPGYTVFQMDKNYSPYQVMQWGWTPVGSLSDLGVEYAYQDMLFNWNNVAEFKIPLDLLIYEENDGSLKIGGRYWQDNLAKPLYIEAPPTKPSGLIDDAYETLDELHKIGDRGIDDLLKHAVEHLENSLDEKRWVDESHVKPGRGGERVFSEGKKAVKDLMTIIKDKNPSEDVEEILLQVINEMIDAYRSLAEIAYEEALQYAGDPDVDEELMKYENEFQKALNDLVKEKYDGAVEHFKRAWKHAQKAIKIGS